MENMNYVICTLMGSTVESGETRQSSLDACRTFLVQKSVRFCMKEGVTVIATGHVDAGEFGVTSFRVKADK